MKTTLLGITLLFITFISSAHTWKDSDDAPRAETLAKAAISDNADQAKAAIAELREIGPTGLETMMAAYADKIKTFKDTGEKTPEWLKLADALDGVAMQRD